MWKLSPIDLQSYSRWYDYSRARDDMFAATDRPEAPWFVAMAEDQKRARLNIISHLLSQIPYEKVPREKVKLPERQRRTAIGNLAIRSSLSPKCTEVRTTRRSDEAGQPAASRRGLFRSNRECSETSCRLNRGEEET